MYQKENDGSISLESNKVSPILVWLCVIRTFLILLLFLYVRAKFVLWTGDDERGKPRRRRKKPTGDGKIPLKPFLSPRTEEQRRSRGFLGKFNPVTLG